jgi:hypothetical protein
MSAAPYSSICLSKGMLNTLLGQLGCCSPAVIIAFMWLVRNLPQQAQTCTQNDILRIDGLLAAAGCCKPVARHTRKLSRSNPNDCIIALGLRL